MKEDTSESSDELKGTLQNWFLLTKQLLQCKRTLYVIHHIHYLTNL